MKKTTEASGREKVLGILQKLVDRFLESANREDLKLTVQDFLRVATALNEAGDDEDIEEIRVRWIGSKDADAQ